MFLLYFNCVLQYYIVPRQFCLPQLMENFKLTVLVCMLMVVWSEPVTVRVRDMYIKCHIKNTDHCLCYS